MVARLATQWMFDGELMQGGALVAGGTAVLRSFAGCPQRRQSPQRRHSAMGGRAVLERLLIPVGGLAWAYTPILNIIALLVGGGQPAAVGASTRLALHRLA
jgi:hypothetical protein